MNPTPNQIIEKLTPDVMTGQIIGESLHDVAKIYAELSKKSDADAVARGAVLLKRIKSLMKRRLGGHGKKKQAKRS